MANADGASAHVQVPANIVNYDATSEGPLGKWDSVDPRSGVCAPGSWDNPTEFPSDGVWKQT